MKSISSRVGSAIGTSLRPILDRAAGVYYDVIQHHTGCHEERKTREVYFLLWDEENEEHLAEHGITVAEAREMLSNRHITIPNPRQEGRITLIGSTNGGRVLAISLDPTGDPGTWRPVTGLAASEHQHRLFDRYCR